MPNVYIKEDQEFQRVPAEEVVTVELPTLGYKPDDKVLTAVLETIPATKIVVIKHLETGEDTADGNK